LNGQVHNDFNVVSYVVTAESDTSDWTRQQSMTPQFNQMPVVANIQEQIENGETVTIGFSLNTLVVEGYGAIELL
jgi:3-deoxy-D-arabino-heptulosonate 7-phosphate (DAHP) synthase